MSTKSFPWVLGWLFLSTVISATAQDKDPRLLSGSQEEEEESDWYWEGETQLVSKFMWRGQRLTDGWNLQTLGAVGFRELSISVWGTMDLTSSHEGDSHYLAENPEAPAGSHHGLRGRFSEVDFEIVYEKEFGPAALTGGAVIYTFPYRTGMIPSTTEIYGGFALGAVPLSPSALVYVDIDESVAAGNTSVYVSLAGSHAIEFSHSRLTGLDLEAALGIANSGFSEYSYEETKAGLHDLCLSAALPILLGKHLNASVFLSYSALLGPFRDFQYLPEPKVYQGTSLLPRELADTVWGGVTFSFE